jgi:hypothetical protein
MADTKFLDGDGVLYVWQEIKNDFVKKEAGKGLSTNDFTTDEKTKLAGLGGSGNYTLPAASAVTLGGVKIGANLTVTEDGTLSATSPITKVSQLTNDANFITASANITGNAATATTAASATKATQDASGNVIADTYAKKTDVAGYQTQAQVNALIEAKVASVVRYKGTLADKAALTALTGMAVGDMYNVDGDGNGMNYVYNGSTWDPQAPTVTITSLTNSDLDAIFAQ